MTNQPVKCFHHPHSHCRKYSFPLLPSASLSIDDNVGGTMSTKAHHKANTYTMDESGSAGRADVCPASVSSSPSFLYTPSFKPTRLTSATTPLHLQSLSTLFTKGYYFYQYTFAQISSALLHLSSSASLCSLSRIQSLVTLILIISLNIPSSTDALGLYQQSSCETHGWNAFPVWKYRAKPRFVPPLSMDRKMQREFLELFRGGGHYKDDSSSSSEEDSYEDDFHLDVQELKRIADMCPKDAFFYSLSPNHLEATQALARMLVAQPSPVEVLKLAKALLRSPYVNPKVWYTAIIAASQERPDMTGFKLAHPIDAIPDLFVPGPLLFEVMDKYKSALKKRSGEPVAVNGTFTRVHQRQKRAFSGGYKVTKNKKKTPRRNGRNNETIVHSFGKIGIGHDDESQQKTKTSRNNVVNLDKHNNNRNSIKSHSSGSKPSASAEDNSKLRSLFYSLAVASKLVKNKRKKISKNMKKADVAAALIGNVTEFRADSGMWKKARIDAFDDCIVVDGSVGVRNGIENKLWYFREDMMVNQHHWYWHQEFPLNATRRRHRSGELFYYMHRNLVARYNAERLSNGLGIVPMFDIRPGAEIRTAYDSQLADVNSGKFWTPRPHGTRFTDIIHEDDPDFMRNLFVGQYNQLYGRLKRSIDVGHLLVGKIKTLKIGHTKGIEPLSNTVEATDGSVNPLFYDAMGFHNLGHQLIGLAADPKFKARLPTGVMADTLTTMRDPEFYSYHTAVDNLFDMYKRSLPPYKPRGGEYPLRWDGVEILDVEVISKNGGHAKNQLRTFWSTRRYELEPGVDKSIHNGDLEVDVCAVHLNHEPFDFKITVTLDPCAHTKSNKGSVRIFLAPRYDEHGHRYSLTVQRRLMIHMDTFPVDLRVGRNVLYRRSFDSNALQPWSKSLKQYEHAPKHPHSAEFCGCGWPTHLYIPKGSAKGTHFDVFVMLTNHDHDYVEEDPHDLPIPEPCNSPYMYCGIKWHKYPDAKPMGYPFDRLPFSVPIKCPRIGAGPTWSLLLCKFLQLFWNRPVASLEEFVSYAPNMASTVVEITHLDKLVW